MYGGRMSSIIFTCMCLMAALCSVWARVHWSSLPSLHPPSGHWSPCGSLDTSSQGTLCRCLQHVADCTDRNLTEIPRFDRPVYKLLFAFNQFRRLGNTEIAANITHLDLSHSGTLSSHEHLLSAFKRLRVLDISRNHVIVNKMRYVFRLSTLEKLDISFRNEYASNFLFKDWFPPDVDLPNLQVLYMNFYDPTDNRVINMTMFQVFPRLRELEFTGTSIATPSVFEFSFLPNLEKLVLCHHTLQAVEFFDECPGRYHNSSYFPKLSYLDLSQNHIANCFLVCLPELRTLVLDYNPILTTIDLRSLPKVENLSFKSACYFFDVQDYSAREIISTSLLTLDLSKNPQMFTSEIINDKIFDKCPNLTELNLEGNDLSGVSQARVQRLFAGLRSLRHVNLGNTKLDKVDTVMGQHLNNVTHLFLHNNLITEIPSGAFDELHELRVLRLDGNQISWLSQSSFRPQTLARLTSLNLSHNPWQCTCSLLWLRDWVSQQPGLFDYHNPCSSYECRNRPGRDVVTFLHHEQPCLLGHDPYVLTVVCAALLISALTVGVLLYLYRWHIRLVLYEAFRGKPEARRPRVGGGDLQYDLFVSYDSEDSHWVLYTLLPHLEQQMSLRVCVHQRDFIPGKNIVDNILHCLDASKRVLAVFSPSFAESPWCHFELEMCLSHVIDSNDVMVVVMLRHVPSRDMSGAMLALINTTTYIEWGDHPDVRESFWRRMTLALKDVLPGDRRNNTAL